MNPTIAAGIAILSAVATLGGGILTGALILWRFSTMLATMRSTSESGHERTSTAVKTLSDQTATALQAIATQAERGLKDLKDTLGQQIQELKEYRHDHDGDINMLKQKYERLNASIEHLVEEMKDIRARYKSLQNFPAQKG